MDYVPDYVVSMRRPLEETDWDLKLHGRRRIEFELVGLVNREFSHAVLASSILEGTKVLLGWLAFYHRPFGPLDGINPNWIELRETKIDSGFFQMRLGIKLVELALAWAAEQGKTVYLKPQRPGEEFAREYRDREWPMSTEQIRAFYLRHGFRDLTLSERFRFSTHLLEKKLDQELFFAGLDVENGGFGPRRYSRSPEDPVAIQIGKIPLRRKLELLLRHFEIEKERNYMDRPDYNPPQLVHGRITRAARETKGILLAREDLKLPQFPPGHRILYSPRPFPQRTGSGHVHV